MMGAQPKEYNHTDIQTFALKMFNNQTALREWETIEKKPQEGNQESKSLALLTEAKDLKCKMINSEPKLSRTNSMRGKLLNGEQGTQTTNKQ